MESQVGDVQSYAQCLRLAKILQSLWMEESTLFHPKYSAITESERVCRFAQLLKTAGVRLTQAESRRYDSTPSRRSRAEEVQQLVHMLRDLEMAPEDAEHAAQTWAEIRQDEDGNQPGAKRSKQPMSFLSEPESKSSGYSIRRFSTPSRSWRSSRATLRPLDTPAKSKERGRTKACARLWIGKSRAT